MKLLLIALSFFTRIPIGKNLYIDQDNFYKSMLLLPIVGLIIGFILYYSSYLYLFFKYPPIVSLLILIIYFFITGGLHYDGLSDSFDALGSNKSQEETINILKDPHIGSFGSLGISLTLLTFYIMNLYIIENKELILLLIYPIIGRIGALELGAFFRPNKNNKGLGYYFCKVDKPIYFWLYGLLCLIIFLFLFSLEYSIALISVFLLTFLIGHYISNKINGITGDFLGLIIEIDQIIYIFSFIIIKNTLNLF